ncbi:hypothetical protein C1H76_4725 [Elsinoe australis]|uniref:Uncharacterized protein n=1 Tax=Elsinoe australis TaxID=40998 RepID=A0A4U7AX03_9PEZI|nr:hypothetical protein C1H76_4725 [Elsinoe australis]
MVITIPRLGLRYSFLLNGALSMAALESSITTRDPAASRRYFHAALSYYDAAHLAFRQYLPSVRKNTELQYSLYMFSALVVALEMGIPLCGKAQGLPLREEKGEKGLLRQIEQLFDVQSGMVQLAFADYEGFARSDYGPALVRANEVLKSPLVGGLAISTEAALTRVKTVIECGSEDKVVVYHAALESLRICFVEEQRDTIKGLSLAYPSMVGKEFVELFKSGDDVALFVLMHWGVMLHRIGIFAWWATSFGQSLVTELSGKSMLSNAPQAALPEWWESIAWVRNQVGLDQGHGESTLSLADLSLFPSTHVRHG